MVRTESRAVVRSVYGHVINQFSRMGSLPHFLTHGAPLCALRARELRYEHLAELFIPRGMTHWLVRPSDVVLVGVEAFFTGHLSIFLVHLHGTLIGQASKFSYSKGKVVPYEQNTEAAERFEMWEGGSSST